MRQRDVIFETTLPNFVIPTEEFTPNRGICPERSRTLQVAGQQKKILQLTGGSHGHTQKAAELSGARPSTSFGNICCTREAATPQLARDSVGFFTGEAACEVVNR